MDTGVFCYCYKHQKKLNFLEKKLNDKKYYRHTGHPGGIKSTNPYLLMGSKPEEILKLAVKRMLPTGPLAQKTIIKIKNL